MFKLLRSPGQERVKAGFCLVLLLFLCSNVYLHAQFYRAPYYFTSKVLDTNYLKMINNNYGFTLSDSITGVFWLHDEPDLIVYDQGLFFITKISGEIYQSEAMWGSLYSPGPIMDSLPAMVIRPQDSLQYHVYKMSLEDTSYLNPDFQEWPLDWGAPGIPGSSIKLYGDQMLWSVYNGFDSSCVVPVIKGRENYPAFPVEVHQTAFAYKDNFGSFDFLKDVIFLEYTIINRGNIMFDSCYVGMWTDIDSYGMNNYPAVDTTLQLGYCWSDYISGNPNPWFQYDSSLIPAVGYVQLYGPSVYSPGSRSTFSGETRNNQKNLNLSSFWGFYDDSFPDLSDLGPAYSRNTAWNIARGYDKRGNDIIDTTTGEKTNFRYAGDPVTGTGWLADWHPTSGGAGFYIFSGPFNLAPSDTQWVMYALIAARGGDNLRSITELRRRALALRNTDYADLVRFTEIKTSESPGIILPDNFRLEQNYPNPFNGTTVIEYSLPYRTHFTFEVFDVLGRRTELFNGEKDPGDYILTVNSAKLSSGVYFYRISAGGFSSIKKMVVIR